MKSERVTYVLANTTLVVSNFETCSSDTERAGHKQKKALAPLMDSQGEIIM
jgi:hypothetical protein